MLPGAASGWPVDHHDAEPAHLHTRSDPADEPVHAREFSATELCNLVQNTGFAIVQQAGIHAGRRVQHLDRKHDGLVAAQLAAPPENWVAALRADVASIRAADFTIVAAADRDVDTALDLVLIARRPT